jgi:predicted ribosomally synthesized peptide with nif11-like leader
MSKENLEQFMSKVADSEELQAKIGEEIDAEALIALGAECGCEFTADELIADMYLVDKRFWHDLMRFLVLFYEGQEINPAAYAEDRES